MKLQAKDLMVGDWVYAQDYPTKALPKKVKPEHFVRSLVEFEPIPLTQEILEKNGWILEWGLEWNNDDAIDLMAEWEDDRFWWFLGDTPVVAINYVHELQHVLRLCGIEKEIEL